MLPATAAAIQGRDWSHWAGSFVHPKLPKCELQAPPEGSLQHHSTPLATGPRGPPMVIHRGQGWHVFELIHGRGVRES